ncbi:hypothetical protein FNF31_05186 [Cafeteria roenbergensis]|uniref:USP domain-containing protein n=1 Tax=Cafeteria roenbergensis TaxID=33653 RepID=A0A5A8D0F2_CAFRO|nr:hypothetical protein FNF31_05186 [Cafeteria roenbergensis]
MSSYGGGYGAVGGQKLNDHVEYPARIRLDETLLPRLASLAKALSSPLRDWLLAVLDVDVPSPVTRHALNANPCRTYSLAAVCMHHGGSATSGHYTAIGATTGSGSHDRSWARYDDSYVQRVDEADALSESRDAYMLFYVQDPPTVAEGHLSVALPWTAIESSDDDEDGGDDGREEDSAGMGAAGKRAVDAAVELVGKDDGSPVQLALSGDRTPSTPSPPAAPLSRGAGPTLRYAA